MRQYPDRLPNLFFRADRKVAGCGKQAPDILLRQIFQKRGTNLKTEKGRSHTGRRRGWPHGESLWHSMHPAAPYELPPDPRTGI